MRIKFNYIHLKYKAVDNEKKIKNTWKNEVNVRVELIAEELLMKIKWV